MYGWKTVLHYDARCIDDLYAMLLQAGDWVEPAGQMSRSRRKTGTVRSLGEMETNSIGGWYGLKKGLRGRFGVLYPPADVEAWPSVLCELEHNAKGNRIRAK